MSSHEHPFFPGHAHFAPEDACNQAGAECAAQRFIGADALGAKLSPIKTETGHFAALRDGSDAGGATSGHSDTTYQPLLPASATAAAAEGPAGHLLAQQREPASPDSVVTAPKPPAAAGSPASAAVIQLPDLVPLPPPDASEGAEAAAEYEMYLQRWDAGDTLAQRWHRLAQQGKLVDIEADWEDWQLDQMLVQVRTRSQAAQAQQRSGAVTPSTGCAPTRLRRGRAEVEEATDAQADEPRRVRSRRAPSTLQDYHVENTPGRTPERQDADPAAAAAAAGAYNSAAAAGATDASDDSTDEAPFSPAAQQYQPQQVQQQQQQQQQRPAIPRGPSFQAQVPKRPNSRLQRQMPAQPQQQAQQQPRQFSRVITAYNPQLYQQQQMHAQAQQQARAQYAQQQQQLQVQVQQQQMQQQQMQQQPQQAMLMMQQLMTQLQPSSNASQQIPPEMTEMWFKIGSALGSMMQEKGGAANMLTNPQAMSAMVEAVLRQTTGDPEAAMQQLVATMAASNAAL